MKRSELKLTGDSFKLTPDTWGEEYIIYDPVGHKKFMSRLFIT